MGGNSSKEEEVVKAKSFKQEMLRNDSFSLINLHMPSSAWGALLILMVLGLSGMGYGLARYKDFRRRAAMRAATTLGVIKPGPTAAYGGSQVTRLEGTTKKLVVSVHNF